MLRLFLPHLNAFHMHQPLGDVYLLALPSKGIQGRSVLFDGGISTGLLPNVPRQGLSCFFHLPPCGIVIPHGNHLAGSILGIRRCTEGNLGNVGFFLVHQVIKQTSRLADHDGQHAGRFRIQRSGMTDSLLPRQAAQTTNHGSRSHSRRLQNVQESVHAVAPFISSFMAATTRLTATCSGALMVHPAASSWPPPPIILATLSTV